MLLLSTPSSPLQFFADYQSGDHKDLIVWMLEHHHGEPVVLGNATLGTTIANDTKTPSADLDLPLPIQSVSSS